MLSSRLWCAVKDYVYVINWVKSSKQVGVMIVCHAHGSALNEWAYR